MISVQKRTKTAASCNAGSGQQQQQQQAASKSAGKKRRKSGSATNKRQAVDRELGNKFGCQLAGRQADNSSNNNNNNNNNTNNPNNKQADESVWIFGLINNIEQLLATFNSVNNQSRSRQANESQKMSSSVNSSGYSTPSSLSPPFAMSSCSSSSSSCHSSYSSCSCSSSAHSSTGSPASSPSNSALPPASNCTPVAACAGSAPSTGLKPATNQQANQQQQLPRSPVSRQIKFHEYKGPPQVRRPASTKQQHQPAAAGGATGQRTSAGAPQRSQSSSCAPDQPLGATRPAPEHQQQAPVRCSNGLPAFGPTTACRQQQAYGAQLELNFQQDQANLDQRVASCGRRDAVHLAPSGSGQMISAPSAQCANGPQQRTYATALGAQRQPATFGPREPACVPVGVTQRRHIFGEQQQQAQLVADTRQPMGPQVGAATVVMQCQQQQQQQQQQQIVMVREQAQQAEAISFPGRLHAPPADNFGPELSLSKHFVNTNASLTSSCFGDGFNRFDTNLDNNLAQTFGPDSEQTAFEMQADDTCDIEPTISFGGQNFDETLLFSEFIDLQDVPLNVDESDWLKKFLPPCSMG